MSHMNKYIYTIYLDGALQCHPSVISSIYLKSNQHLSFSDAQVFQTNQFVIIHIHIPHIYMYNPNTMQIHFLVEPISHKQHCLNYSNAIQSTSQYNNNACVYAIFCHPAMIKFVVGLKYLNWMASIQTTLAFRNKHIFDFAVLLNFCFFRMEFI